MNFNLSIGTSSCSASQSAPVSSGSSSGSSGCIGSSSSSSSSTTSICTLIKPSPPILDISSSMFSAPPPRFNPMSTSGGGLSTLTHQLKAANMAGSNPSLYGQNSNNLCLQRNAFGLPMSNSSGYQPQSSQSSTAASQSSQNLIQMSNNGQLQMNGPSLIASVLAANTAPAFSGLNQSTLSQNGSQSNCGTASNSNFSLNNTLFVGNLHASLQEVDLIQVFRPFGRIVECCKKWLHFGFVKFTTEEEACHAYVTLNGFRLKGRPMRLEFQNRTKKARIKALLAQAALQAPPNLDALAHLNAGGTNSNSNCFDIASSLGSFSSFLSGSDDQQRQQQYSMHNQMPPNHYQQQHQQYPIPPHLSNYYMNQQQQHFTQQHHMQPQPPMAYQQRQQQFNSDRSAPLPATTPATPTPDVSFFNTEHLIKFAVGVDAENQQLHADIDFEKDAQLDKALNNDLFNSYLLEITEKEKTALFANEFSDLIGDKTKSLSSEIQINTSSTSLAKLLNASSQANDSCTDSASMLSNLLKRAALSPNPHQCTATGSSSLSVSPRGDTSSVSSRDSGCRSGHSFLLLNADCDSTDNSAAISPYYKTLSSSSLASSSSSGIGKSSATDIKTDKSSSLADDCISISEHMEFTYSHSNSPKKSSSVKVQEMNETSDDEDDINDSDDVQDDNSDTSDDASDIPECLDELDLECDSACLSPAQLDIDQDIDEVDDDEDIIAAKDIIEMALSKYNQVVDSDGSLVRRKLELGQVYRSINQTYSLFIEPNDVLKQLDDNDYVEYSLFPNGLSDESIAALTDSYSMVIKEHFYSV